MRAPTRTHAPTSMGGSLSGLVAGIASPEVGGGATAGGGAAGSGAGGGAAVGAAGGGGSAAWAWAIAGTRRAPQVHIDHRFATRRLFIPVTVFRVPRLGMVACHELTDELHVGGSGRRLVDDTPLAHDQDAVREGEDFIQIGAHEQDGRSSFARLTQALVNLRDGREIETHARVGRD